jgi:hypothetical protein
MDQFLADQINVISEVVNDPAILTSAASGLAVAEVRLLVERSRQFVKENHARVGNRPFVLSFTADPNGKAALGLEDVLKATANKTPIIDVDAHLRVVSFNSGGTRVSDAEQRTGIPERVEIVVHGTYVYVVAHGQVVKEYDAILSEKHPPLGIAFYKPISQFDGLLHDHYEQDVAKEKSFRYWEDAGKRVLLATPENTEKIFQRGLYNWLSRYVTDSIRIVAETRSFGQDPADVLVITPQGDHIIEVKWLGINGKKTSYGEPRINEGLRQVCLYITNDPKIIQGHLVLYDGRFGEDHEQHSGHDPTCKHAFCSDPKILFLESESPSQKAKHELTENTHTPRKSSTKRVKKKETAGNDSP